MDALVDFFRTWNVEMALPIRALQHGQHGQHFQFSLMKPHWSTLMATGWLVKGDRWLPIDAKMAELAEVEDFVTPPTSPIPEEEVIPLSHPDGENASPLAEADGASCSTPHDGVKDVVMEDLLSQALIAQARFWVNRGASQPTSHIWGGEDGEHFKLDLNKLMCQRLSLLADEQKQKGNAFYSNRCMIQHWTCLHYKKFAAFEEAIECYTTCIVTAPFHPDIAAFYGNRALCYSKLVPSCANMWN